MSRRLSACALAVSLLTACESKPTVSTDVNPTTDFTKFHTFAWIQTEPPVGVNPLTFERVHDEIERDLIAKGYTLSDTPDFAVSFTIGARENVDVTDYGPYTYYPDPFFYSDFGYPSAYYAGGYSRYRVTSYTEGTLAVDIYDAKTRKPVWFGVATKRLTAQEAQGVGVSQELIDEVVGALMAEFPPPAQKPVSS